MSFRTTIENKHFALVIIDILMIVILGLNLLLLSFDWVFSVDAVGRFLAAETPAFFSFYSTHIHAHFLTIDLAFVAFFLAEFSISWFVAIHQKTYHRWFFYPFLHWYDLLGCIPLNAFRVVRVLRVFTIVYRLHKLRIIRLEKTFPYRTAKKYYGILLEEVSDRVVENIIDEMQTEIKEAGPTLESIVSDVLRPKQTVIVEWASLRLAKAAEHNFDSRRREIREYVEHSIAHAFRKNDDIRKIEQIPMVGKGISDTLERSIGNIVFNIIENAMGDLASSKNRSLVEEVTEIAFCAIEKQDGDNSMHDLVMHALVEVLEIVKKQVAHIKRWKLKELAEKVS